MTPRWFFFGLLFLTIPLAGSSQTPEDTDIFTKNFIKKLRKGKAEVLFEVCFTKADMQIMRDTLATMGSAPNISLDSVYSYYTGNKMNHLERLIDKGDKWGIKWKKIKLEEISFREVEENHPFNEAQAEVFVNCKGVDYLLEINSIFWVGGKWKVADFIFLEKRDGHAH